MTRRLATLATALLALAFATPVLAGSPLTAGAPLPPSVAGQAVYDFADIWSDGAVAEAEALVAAERARSGTQIAVVSWPTYAVSVEKGTATTDAATIMKTWGVGNAGRNDGLVILFDMDATFAHGQIKLCAGRDLLGAGPLPEALTQAIYERAMRERARAGDFDGAMLAGLRESIGALRGESAIEIAPWERLPVSPLTLALAAALALIWALFLRDWWANGRDAPALTIDDSVLLPAPPAGMTPAFAAYLRDRGSPNVFAAAVADLASRGALRIRANHEGKEAYLELLDGPLDTDGLGGPEATLNEALVALAGELRVLDAERLGSSHGQVATAAALVTNLGKRAYALGWYRSDPTAAGGCLYPVVSLPLLLLGIVSAAGASEAATAFGLLAPAISLVALLRLIGRLAARSEEGQRAAAMAEAYANTLGHALRSRGSIADALAGAQERMPWLATPDTLVVYAIAFGLADELAQAYERSIAGLSAAEAAEVYAPAWCAVAGSGFATTLGSLGSLGSISTDAASFGSGGSGGGGFGGGGGGGGGGGDF